MTEQRNIVILGASAAGISTTHYILKHILPTLKKTPDVKYHVYTIAPSSRYLFRIATPRVATSTKLMSADKIVMDLNSGFNQYSADDFTFIEASATGWDEAARTVAFRSSKDTEETRLQYHALIVATGSKTYYPAFSSSGNIQDTLDAITTSNEKVQTAKKIVIVGGGPTGVEFAGEVGEFLNGKPGWFSKGTRNAEITLITADKQLLPSLRPAIGKLAEQKLNALGVDVLYNTRVTNTTSTKDNNRTSITLATGETLEADLYVPAYGVEPNSSWIPGHLLSEKKYLLTNAETLRVDVAGPRVYALGDIGSYSRNNIWDILSAQPVLFTNLKRDLLSFNPALPDEKAKGKDRVFKTDTRESMVVPIGSATGVGAVMGWKVPGWFVWALKGRDYMLGMSAVPMVSGESVKKEVMWSKEEAAI
jgi:NADH dehydrogenase FAD-containing subunit